MRHVNYCSNDLHSIQTSGIFYEEGQELSFDTSLSLVCLEVNSPKHQIPGHLMQKNNSCLKFCASLLKLENFLQNWISFSEWVISNHFLPLCTTHPNAQL